MTEKDSEDTSFHLLGIPAGDESHELRSRVPFELLASQFVDELRSGKSPSVDLYARRFPPHAEKIREVFPVLAMLENARIQKEAQSIRRNMPERFPFTRLGNCELLTEVGRGGMGVVYQGRDLHSGHLVAVKILPWRVSVVPEWVERFEREARIAAKLRHRNIVPVFRYGQENGYCYFVMQFVNGIGIDQIIARLGEHEGVIPVSEIRRQQVHRLPRLIVDAEVVSPAEVQDSPSDLDRRLTRRSWASFVKVGIQATQALRAAHAAEILHNDIKPGNILLDAEGRVWVSDFGLSQPLPAVDPNRPVTKMTRTSSGDRSIAGTLKYMAPERLMGQQSTACDLYSLGATLYELCLQRPVFDHPDRDELIRKILEEEPVRPRDVCREIPKGLETIILNCIARHPTDRYANADTLLADLLKHARGQSVSSTSRGSFSGFFRSIRDALRTPRKPD
jgi:serine/threonine protein kinase